MSTAETARGFDISVARTSATWSAMSDVASPLAARAWAECKGASIFAMFSDSVGPSQHVGIVDPLDSLCAGDFCAPIIDGTVMFSDAHHLSEAGSLKLLPAYASALEWSLDSGESATATVATSR